MCTGLGMHKQQTDVALICTYIFLLCPFFTLPLSSAPPPGGEDFDQRVIDYFVKMYKRKHKHDITTDKRAIQKLRREVEKAKRSLSSQHQARIDIEQLYAGEDFSETLTRARFEDLNMVGPFVRGMDIRVHVHVELLE